MSEVTPRELLRRRIQERLRALSEKEQSESEVLITDLFQLFLDLDEESQKQPIHYIPPSFDPWYPTPWQPVPGRTIPSYPWWDSRNPYKITMTTNTATVPTEFEMIYETSGYEEVPSSEGAGKDFDDGEPVPA